MKFVVRQTIIRALEPIRQIKVRNLYNYENIKKLKRENYLKRGLKKLKEFEDEDTP